MLVWCLLFDQINNLKYISRTLADSVGIAFHIVLNYATSICQFQSTPPTPISIFLEHWLDFRYCVRYGGAHIAFCHLFENSPDSMFHGCLCESYHHSNRNNAIISFQPAATARTYSVRIYSYRYMSNQKVLATLLCTFSIIPCQNINITLNTKSNLEPCNWK